MVNVPHIVWCMHHKLDDAVGAPEILHMWRLYSHPRVILKLQGVYLARDAEWVFFFGSSCLPTVSLYAALAEVDHSLCALSSPGSRRTLQAGPSSSLSSLLLSLVHACWSRGDGAKDYFLTTLTLNRSKTTTSRGTFVLGRSVRRYSCLT